ALLDVVAGASRRAADRARVARRMLAGVAAPVALVAAARVAVVRARRARRALRVRWAARARPGAHLGRVALACRRAADDEARLEHVVGTGAARPRAVLLHVANAGGRAADRPGVARRVLAGVARAVARVGRAGVAVVGARGARRGLRIGRTRRPRPRTVLRRVALAARRTTDGGGRLERVGRARAARPGAELVEVAVARRGATDGPGVPRRVLAEVARAVAGIRRARVAVVGAQRPARLLRVGSARLARQSAAALRDVALAGRRPADDADRQEHVGWA